MVVSVYVTLHICGEPYVPFLYSRFMIPWHFSYDMVGYPYKYVVTLKFTIVQCYVTLYVILGLHICNNAILYYFCWCYEFHRKYEWYLDTFVYMGDFSVLKLFLLIQMTLLLVPMISSCTQWSPIRIDMDTCILSLVLWTSWLIKVHCIPI